LPDWLPRSKGGFRLFEAGNVFEDFGGVAFGFYDFPDFFDFAVGAYEEGAADDAHEGAAHEMFFPPGAELLDGFVVGIAEQGEIEFFLFFEGGLGGDRVRAHPQDSYAVFLEILFCVTKLGRFDCSTGGVGFGIEKEQDAVACEVLKGNGFPFV
jgi:hypothetical protein